MKEVLLVEDDDDVREFLSESLSNTGKLKVSAVASVIECLDRLSNPGFHPAAVIIDLHIKSGAGGDVALREFKSVQPKGFRLAQRIHREHPELPIFGITGLTTKVAPECEDWFREKGDPVTGIGVYDKHRNWVLLRHRVLKLIGETPPVKVFLVHGHDHTTRDELGEFAERLGWNVKSFLKACRKVARGSKDLRTKLGTLHLLGSYSRRMNGAVLFVKG